MFFIADVYFTGLEKQVSSDGVVYTNFNTCGAMENDASNMRFNVSNDCVFDGFDSLEKLPRFSHCSLTLNYLSTKKGNFFILQKIRLVKDK